MNEAIDRSLPDLLQKILTADACPDTVFSTLLPALGKGLNCDRCFLYLRNPQTRMGKVTHCWVRSDRYPFLLDDEWKEEPDSLVREDPLFAAALQGHPSIFIEDVETADPTVVNREFEQQNFGHRALIHGHLYGRSQEERESENDLWGILQPSLFNSPRIWTERDRQIVTQVVEAIIPLAIDFIKQANT